MCLFVLRVRSICLVFYLLVSVCLYLAVCLSLCVGGSVGIPVYENEHIYCYDYFIRSVCVCLYVSVCVCMCVSLSVCVSMCVCNGNSSAYDFKHTNLIALISKHQEDKDSTIATER